MRTGSVTGRVWIGRSGIEGCSGPCRMSSPRNGCCMFWGLYQSLLRVMVRFGYDDFLAWLMIDVEWTFGVVRRFGLVACGSSSCFGLL